MMAFAAILSLLLLAGVVHGDEDAYHWPLDRDPVLTSSFAEYRANRYHMGIDLRTQAIGLPVRAPRDGYVNRVRVSPYGYGKALYIQLDDGNTAVFAHLDDFAEPIREYVFNAQHVRRQYTVDLYPAAERFQVERGEVVAYTGRTGVGAPHLHYELRDPANRAINPRLAGVTWPDSTPPEFHTLLIEPRDPGATVNGRFGPSITDVVRDGPGEYRAPAAEIAGTVGFGVDVTDPSAGGVFRMGVHTIEATANGQTLFRIENDKLTYETWDDGAVAFHPYYRDDGRFWVLWRWPGNRSPNYAASRQDGWFDMPRDEVTLTIVARDFMENESRLTVPLRPGTPPAPPAPDDTADDAPMGGLEVKPVYDWLLVTAEFPQPESETPRLHIREDAQSETRPFQRIGDRAFQLGVRPGGGVGEISMAANHPRLANDERRYAVVSRGGAAGAITRDDVTVRAAANSAYGRLYVKARSLEQRPGGAAIRQLGRAYTLGPAVMPIQESLDIAIPFPDGAEQRERVHVYRMTGSGWSAQTTTREAGQLRIRSRSLGTFMAMEDDQPPVIENIRIAGNGQRPSIRATVRDVGSGIDSVEAELGGRWLIMAYDPEQDLTSWEQDHDLPEGAHTLTLRAEDRAGNVTEASRSVEIPMP